MSKQCGVFVLEHPDVNTHLFAAVVVWLSLVKESCGYAEKMSNKMGTN